jgi:Flp pilus assembly protein TadG
MLRRANAKRRVGGTVVEAAIIYPVTFMLILGVISGGMGIFRYQEVASLAREGSRWASTHGSQYAQDTGKPAATAQAVYNNAILPKAFGLDVTKLSYTVTWNPNNQPPNSTVTVKVSYQWSPEVFLLGTFTLSSTSTMPMMY